MLNFKTLYINFKYLPFKQAKRLPIMVSRRTYLLHTKGKILLKGPVSTAMIVIGYGEVGIFDKKKSRTILDVKGTIIFKGKAHIGHGSKLSVAKEGTLELGANFIISAESAIVCHHHIKIGRDTLFSWEILVMDTDLHKIFDEQRNYINPPKPVIIGNKVWIGCRSLILKGVEIPDGNVIPAYSTITKSQTVSNAIITGMPERIIKKAIIWAN